jgi:hypothetical protein
MTITAKRCDRQADCDAAPALSKPREVAKSTLDAVGYLIRQGDAARLQVFLAKYPPENRRAIEKHFDKGVA